jgi:nicotinamidase-related amidase
MLVPVESDHAVLKTNRSGFDATELESLLERVQARTLVLAGFSAEADVLLTARDAHARGYDVLVPSDCTAGSSDELTRQALDRMSSEAEARTDESLTLDLQALRYAQPERD